MINFNKPYHQKHFAHIPELGMLALQPVVSENDELIQSIEAGSEAAWQLDDHPDTEGLAQFWSGVVDDLANDVDLIDFANEDE